jgi:predicted HAD superfamily Cof-like phosphohydrolase
MTKEQEQVREWMLKADQDCPVKPKLPEESVAKLRYHLIQEELDEFDEADNKEEIVEVADALADLMYVVLGTAVAYGIDLEPLFQEVHRSNMSKFIDGHRREDGKWIKGPSYSPANLQPIIEAQSK